MESFGGGGWLVFWFSVVSVLFMFYILEVEDFSVVVYVGRLFYEFLLYIYYALCFVFGIRFIRWGSCSFCFYLFVVR